MAKFKKVLVANRGEIACRIFRSLKKLGMQSIAIYSEADVDSDHVSLADEAFLVGPAEIGASYLRSDYIIELALKHGADAIHPGYGLLSENTQFAEECGKKGVAFIGPTPDQISQFSLKHTARKMAEDNKVPVLPGSPLLQSADEVMQYQERIGFPLMVKSSAGGGGIGMSLCHSPEELPGIVAEVTHLSETNFKNSGVYLERFIERARHVEVQIFGDGKGTVIPLGLRDCSMQRRNQKVVEESPAPGLSEDISTAMTEAAVRLTSAANYRSAGTVEFLFDVDSQEFFFLEVNTRLQVEHGVTEEVFGIDLVEWMIQLQSDNDFGENLKSQTFHQKGHSIQVRIYAEDPSRNFQPSVGTLTVVKHPEWARCESWVFSGTEVCSHYDPLLSKIIVTAENRDAALCKLSKALDECHYEGLETNLEYLKQITASESFAQLRMTTGFLKDFPFSPTAIEIRTAGTMTTIQDFPGRVGYWKVGIPPSGPMDNYSFRQANLLIGNDEGLPGLEFTNDGAMMIFHQDSIIALTGAEMKSTLNGEPIPFGKPVFIPSGSQVRIGRLTGAGARSYMAVKHGIKVTPYLGSCSTFTLGKFGGQSGRALRAGDVVHFTPSSPSDWEQVKNNNCRINPFSKNWQLSVLYGPHGHPDFFTPEGIEEIFQAEWEVHYNSARTGIRLIGPKPKWAREDGGEAGLHPSNIHDNAYAVGAVDFTGDMPVILGVDGPSLGGFVCPMTIIAADLWKMGQLRPGDKVKFLPVVDSDAANARAVRDQELARSEFTVDVTSQKASSTIRSADLSSPVIHDLSQLQIGSDIIVRRSGDSNILIEFGELELDFKYRMLVQLCYQKLKDLHLDFITDLTPGIRSLQVQFDNKKISSGEVVRECEKAFSGISLNDDIQLPSRIVHLPLSWNDPSIQKAIDIYHQSVRKDAPWYPSNIEFIRRINGLDSEEEVKQIIFDANYLVMGLGDVYLGAPVAVPVDPRHRLVTTKYNPARTWTPENAVGIGGSYLCVYGMEGPGGYQLFGRTLQMWNRYRITSEFTKGNPWLLRFFDQIKFYEVSPSELLDIRRDFLHGLYPLKIEETTFSWSQYQQFLTKHHDSCQEFKSRQKSAFNEERERWKSLGQDMDVIEPAEEEVQSTVHVPAGCDPLESVLSGTVWKILAREGDSVTPDKPVMILEAMKMEVPVYPNDAGILKGISVSEGQSISSGQILGFTQPQDD